MDLVDRYLNAVRFWLPKEQKIDVIAELSEDIRLQVEEKEKELGRPLAESDLSDLLKRRGRPFAVAGKFLPQRCLIGPQLYPLYEFVLKLAAGIYVIPSLLVWAGLMIFAPSYRAAHSGADLLQGLGNLWTSLWTGTLILLAMITIGFAVGERLQGKSAARGDWNPRRLPAVRDVLKVSRFSSLADIVFSLFFLVWWLGGFSFPLILSYSGGPQALPPSALWLDFQARFFIPVAVFILAGAILGVVNLIRPNLTPLRAGARAVIDAAVPVMIIPTLAAHAGDIRAAWQDMVRAVEGPAKLAGIRDWSLALTMGIIALGCLVSAVRGVLRIVRWRTLSSSRPTAKRA